jgi:hypothetical protein
MLKAVCLSAVEVLLYQGSIDHEPVRLNDRLQGVTDAAFLLDVVLDRLDWRTSPIADCPFPIAEWKHSKSAFGNRKSAMVVWRPLNP